ncbi:MAG: hypothetical protein ACT4PW_10690 [Acidimicrobiia bacterium]
MYEVILLDQTRALIDDADAYQQEGRMTTFFRHGDGREVVDAWSTRVASFRTDEVRQVRRLASRAEVRPLRAAGEGCAC